MSLSLLIVLVVFPAAMAYAAASDLVSMTITNRLCVGLAIGFLLCAALLGLSWSQIGWHFAAGAVMLAIGIALFAPGWIGGGDAKLVAATALWFGFDQLMLYLLLAAVFGGGLTLVMLTLRAAPLPTVAQNWPWAQRLHAADKGVPYGVALAFSALFVLPETAIWRAAISF